MFNLPLRREGGGLSRPMPSRKEQVGDEWRKIYAKRSSPSSPSSIRRRAGGHAARVFRTDASPQVYLVAGNRQRRGQDDLGDNDVMRVGRQQADVTADNTRAW